MTGSYDVVEVAGMKAVYSIARRERSGDWFAVGTVRVAGRRVHDDRRFWALAATGGTRESALEAFTLELTRRASG